MEAISKISRELNMLDDIPNINYGGCLASAILIKRMLKRHNIESELYVIPYSGKAHRTNIYHAVVRVGGVLIDSGGLYYKESLNYSRSIVIDEETAEEWIADDIWNRDFDRDHMVDMELACNERIYELTDGDLRHYMRREELGLEA